MPQASENPSWQSVTVTVLVALIAATPPTIMAWRASDKAEKASDKAAETHDLVNSRLSEILPLIKKGAADEATLKEKAEQSAREGAAAIATQPPVKK